MFYCSFQGFPGRICLSLDSLDVFCRSCFAGETESDWLMGRNSRSESGPSSSLWGPLGFHAVKSQLFCGQSKSWGVRLRSPGKNQPEGLCVNSLRKSSLHDNLSVTLVLEHLQFLKSDLFFVTDLHIHTYLVWGIGQQVSLCSILWSKLLLSLWACSQLGVSSYSLSTMTTSSNTSSFCSRANEFWMIL